MDQRMPRCATLDLAQADKISALEVAVSVLELPQRRVRRAGVEYIAHCESVRGVSNMFWNISNVPLWKPYMFNCRTNEETFVCLKYDLHHC